MTKGSNPLRYFHIQVTSKIYRSKYHLYNSQLREFIINSLSYFNRINFNYMKLRQIQLQRFQERHDKKKKHVLMCLISGNQGFMSDIGYYDYLLEDIYNNYYRYIAKCPSSMFIQGLMGSKITITRKDGTKYTWSFSLYEVKKYLVEILGEASGVEVCPVDEDWDNLAMIDTHGQRSTKDANGNWSWSKKENYTYLTFNLPRSKSYMGSFFESF